MRNKIFAFMQNRYGVDEFGKFLIVMGFVLNLLGNFRYFSVLKFVGTAMMVYCVYRMMSKKIYVRLSENRKYVGCKNRAVNWIRMKKERFAQRDTHRFFKCPSCKQIVRVPKRRGKIEITCPKCITKFTKKT